MQGKTKQGFVLSVLLHAGVVVGAILFSLLKPIEKPKDMIFELVAPPPSGPVQPAETPTMDFSAPEMPIPEPPKPRVEPPKPKPPEPKPKPPEPKPKPKPPEPKPKPPEVKPVEPPKTMTLEEYRKQNPEKPKPKAPAPKPVKVPRVDTRFNPNLRDTVVNVDTLAGLSQIQQSELQSYIARLRAALELCWAKPSGLAQTIFTEVEFYVIPAGTLTRIRITRSSGHGEFDASVLDAFEALGTGGVTPDGKPLNLRLTFKMNEL